MSDLRAHARVVDPDNVEVELQLVLSMHGWKQIRKALAGQDANGYWCSLLRRKLDDTVFKLEREQISLDDTPAQGDSK